MGNACVMIAQVTRPAGTGMTDKIIPPGRACGAPDTPGQTGASDMLSKAFSSHSLIRHVTKNVVWSVFS